MNIIGEGFPDEIKEQVIKRQKIYGSGYAEGTSRSPEEILYLNANTSWCKLVSSVNLNEPPTFIRGTSGGTPSNNIIPGDMPGSQISPAPGPGNFNNNTGIHYESNNALAKQFVLFNGVRDIDKDQRSGFGVSIKNDIEDIYDQSKLNYAYGIGGTKDFGYRPMMGIQSANITHENRGSIRRAVVKVKAFNKHQFDIIDALYLRLGFSVLLEWGHTMWYDNKREELHKGGDIDNSLAKDFLEGNGTYKDFLDKIYKKRLSSNGNYDAMFAKISNFHWSFLPDGSYDITINLISVGDVVESFKLNVFNGYYQSSTTSSVDENISPQDLGDTAVIELYANSNTIAAYFNSLISHSIGVQNNSQPNNSQPINPVPIIFIP